ncbi:MAG: carbon-nitrogen hydrolase family protein [Alphaproteobacteria bacterium]|nr:amidohydrolase [Rhodobiaceae bacterium]MBO6542587.1 carbon-nitrogen hydrolase family protein [Alphaproteobacteria bacterium]MBO6629399.1 carbon-nitrogen hydrolase family protein [Alphaproteobacteria bacterium]MDF1626021.1 carbon-nitrogen hydrolase family protein [Parvibaculaceae bacterium]
MSVASTGVAAPATFKAALVQLRTGKSVDANIEAASRLIRQAAAQGASFVATPETTSLMELGAERLFANIVREEDDRALLAFRHLAAELGLYLLIGSLAVLAGEGKAANRSFLIGPDGRILARYDKIHMFDVDLGNGEAYRESKNYQAGEVAVLADLPFGRLGLSICYDLRFPHLYRALAHGGADFLTVPSAFTQQTGAAHWHVLLRARAIETGCFVLAPAQGGTHENGRETFGHSMIIAPWGEVLAEAGTDPCVILADIDVARVREARSRVPSLSHDRDIKEPVLSRPE